MTTSLIFLSGFLVGFGLGVMWTLWVHRVPR